jgi:hypothetical protein
MRYKSQMDCRNRSGKYKNGCKVTGMQYFFRREQFNDNSTNTGNETSHSWMRWKVNKTNTNNTNNNNNSSIRRKMTSTAEGQLLVTTNDHRIRLCRLEDYSVVSKYKGLKNEAMQIKSTISEDNEYIICGSDSGDVFIWPVNPSSQTNAHNINSSANVSAPLFMFDKVLKQYEYDMFDGCESGNASSTAAGSTEYANTTNSVICAMFAPSNAFKRYIRSQFYILQDIKNREQNNLGNTRNINGIYPAGNTAGIPRNRSSGKFNSFLGNNQQNNNNVSNLEQRNQMSVNNNEVCSRIIITADADGVIRIFFRMI